MYLHMYLRKDFTMKNTQLLRFLLAGAAAAAAASSFAYADQARAAPQRLDAREADGTPFGRQGDPKRVSRTIRVAMNDKMRFEPGNITVRKGETVRFVVANKGAVLHEMVLGTPQSLKQHAELMRKHPGMEHDEASMAHVRPGARRDIVWQFTESGDFQFACLIPGHFEAGMVGKVTVKNS